MMTNISMRRRGKQLKSVVKYFFISALGFVMVLPLLWLVLASVKPSHEVFLMNQFFPSKIHLENFYNGWKSVKPHDYSMFYMNTLAIVIPVIIGNVTSTCLVSYGFARGQFRLKKYLFGLLIATMMLPSTTTLIPSYIIFAKLGWVNTYLPFIVPSFIGGSAFFIFLMVQFMRGIPHELDESAKIDGCNSFGIFSRIILPNTIPTIITVVVFTFMWTWDDFMGQMIYLSEVKKYTVSLALKMAVDPLAVIDWGAVLAMTLVSIVPMVAVYFFAQNYFVEGIATTGLKD